MRKLAKRVIVCALAVSLVWIWMLISDREKLNEELIRLHVVANSDSQEDQAVKLQVRDAVLESIQQDLQGMTDVQAAKAYLRENLPKIQTVANDTLRKAGFSECAVVTLCQEAFDTRYYDTFALPAGVYESLRIIIGEGEGHNWWCVAFPSLCLPATSAGFEAAAVNAGFSDTLRSTLSEDQPYRIRFFLLDAIGNLECTLFNA